MDIKMEVLIALGSSYALNCQPCLELHKHEAIDAGLTMEEMRAAIAVAESVKKGAYDLARQSAGNLFGNIKEERCCPGVSKCCP